MVLFSGSLLLKTLRFCLCLALLPVRKKNGGKLVSRRLFVDLAHRFPEQVPEKTLSFYLRFPKFNTAIKTRVWKKQPKISKNDFPKQLCRPVSGTRSGKNALALPAFPYCFSSPYDRSVSDIMRIYFPKWLGRWKKIRKTNPFNSTSVLLIL